MATEPRYLARLVAALPAAVLLTVPAPARASSAWWEPLAFAGQRVNTVTAAAGHLVVGTSSGSFTSSDNGATFHRADPQALITPPVGPTQWRIDNGTVVTAPLGRPLAPDPHSPFLGDSAHLIAAPAALPGVAVAVGTDNHVWRRDASGWWTTSLILLPAGGLAGIPQVTSLAAFPQPLSTTVYLGTAGYGVLLSSNGGDDWIRADPGLPSDVRGLAADSSTRALYAATDQGLFVHHLQMLPRPPTYTDAQLYQKWVGIGLIALMATVIAVLGLRRLLPDG